MKKFLIVLLAVLSLTGCPGPYDSNQQVVLSFEEAVQEVYRMTGETLFYSLDGKKPYVTFNKASNGNEIAGLCTDYSIEFAYYWNEVKNYDEVYGKAYLARVPYNSSNFQIQDFKFAPNGTSKIREQSGDFGINGNDYENDGVYRDVFITSVLYSGKNILHFGKYITGHKWVVINIGEDWYDLEPTWWDCTWVADWHEGWANNMFVPYKIKF